MPKSSIRDCKLVTLPKFSNASGSLSFAEGRRHVPFDIKRIYYLYDVPKKGERGGHAHKALRQLMIPIAGSFDIKLDDGTRQKTLHLDRPDKGLMLVPYIWRELSNFSRGAACLVLASAYYDEKDYLRRYDDFLTAVKRVRT